MRLAHCPVCDVLFLVLLSLLFVLCVTKTTTDCIYMCMCVCDCVLHELMFLYQIITCLKSTSKQTIELI